MIGRGIDDTNPIIVNSHCYIESGALGNRGFHKDKGHRAFPISKIRVVLTLKAIGIASATSHRVAFALVP